MTLGASLDWGSDMGSLISPGTSSTPSSPRRRRGRQGRPGAHRRPGTGPTSGRTSSSRPSSRASPPTWPASATRRSARSSSVYRFHDEADAIARANEGEYGLNASIYSQDGRRARAIARQIKCGTVNINEAFGATFGSIDSPMGGMRESGMGRRQGSEGIHRYTESQAVATQRLIRFAPDVRACPTRATPR